ncbi:MAG: glycosyltransferase, partial [Polaromonas sp.]|nr:glycosyltransferase [Polaromonas sp.]
MTISISGFTFIRNGIELGFPFEASIRSLLP